MVGFKGMSNHLMNGDKFVHLMAFAEVCFRRAAFHKEVEKEHIDVLRQ